MSVTLEELFKQLPPEISGWRKSAGFERHGPESLYEYINGGAELFISFEFADMITLKYEKEGEDEIVLDIFDMGTPADAFGVFTQNREETDPRFGQGGEYNSGLLVFWQDRFYASVMAYPESTEKRELVFSLAAELQDGIGKTGALPPILDLLPQTGLQADSIRYFRHYIWQNSLLYISPKNILNIDRKNQCLLARYQRNGSSCLLMLVEYPDSDQAESAEKSFREAYLGYGGRAVVQRDDGLFAGSRRFDALLAVILAASKEELVREITSDLAAGLEKE